MGIWVDTKNYLSSVCAYTHAKRSEIRTPHAGEDPGQRAGIFFGEK